MSTKLLSEQWQNQWKQLIEHLYIVENQKKESELLSQLTQCQSTIVLAFVNAHAMNLLIEKTEFYRALMSADIVLRDGVGMKKLLDSQSRDAGLNMNGTDFIPKVIQQYREKKIAFLGTQEPYLSAAKSVYVNQAGFESIETLDGFQPLDRYVSWCQEHKPELIVLGMGMPKQELLAQSLKEALTFPCLIVCGGAILDFIGGKVDRAPKWMRDSGLEWVYRFFKEPKRLFKRYVIGNPLFLYRANQIKKTL